MKRATVKKTAAKKVAKSAAKKVVKKIAKKKVAKKAVKKAAATAKVTRATPSRAKAKPVSAKKTGLKKATPVRKAAAKAVAKKETSVKKIVKKPAAKTIAVKPLRKLATKPSPRPAPSKLAPSKAANAAQATSAKKRMGRPEVVKTPSAANVAKATTPNPKTSMVNTAATKPVIANVRKTPAAAPEKPVRVVSIVPSKPAARPPQSVPARDSTVAGPVSPEVATAHFQELLRAKQERVRQGPTYPAANPYTGRHDASGGNDHGDDLDSHGPPLSNTPEPEAVYGASTAHARGNQGMRKPK
jgi:hypothetical protein